MSRSVTGVDQRDSRDLGKYSWVDWEGVTLRACCNWALVCRSIGGFLFCVCDLLRHAMG